MKKLQLFLSLVIIGALLLTVTACSQSNDRSNTNDNGLKETITFGLMPSIDAIPMIIAQEKGFFEAHGVQVELQHFKSAKDRDAAFQSGNLDGMNSNLVAVGLYHEGGFDVKITSMTTGLFDLVTTPAITSVQDLKGKKITISKNTANEYILDKMLEAAGLTADDVTKEEVPAIPTRLELLRNKQSEAAILPEPYVTMAVTSGFPSLTNTEAIGLNPLTQVFSQTVIAQKTDEIEALCAAYDDAVDYLNSHPIDDYVDIVIESVGFPEELRDQLSLPVFQKSTLPKDEDVELAFDWLRNKGLLKKDLQPSDVLFQITTNME